MNNKPINFFFFLLIFYVTFPFVFKEQHLLQDLIFLGISVLIIVSNYKLLLKKTNILSTKKIFLIMLFSLLSIFSIAYPIYLGTMDFTYFRGIYFTSLQLLITHLAMITIFIKLYKEKATFELLTKFYIGSCLMYILTTFILISIPPLKEIWLSVLYISETDIEHLLKPQYSTRIGIDGFAGFRQTLRFSIGIVLNSFLIVKTLKSQKKLSWLFYVSLIFLLLGTLLYGRIGSVVSIATLFILLVFFLGYQKTMHFGVSILSFSFIGILLLIGISFLSEPIRIWFEWAFELIINFVQTGKFSSTSTDILFEKMYFVPSLKEFFVGEGWFTDPISGSYFGGTDVGFLRSILFFGIFPTLINYFIPFFIISDMKNALSKQDKLSSRFLGSLLFLLFIVFEIKGGIFHYLIPYLIPFYIIVDFQKKSNSNIKEVSL
ncbi:hypothetical protein SAMN05878443_1895 [Carnobacterium alterfunditum]|uniref:Uncharacterized protein n=1 Tax=Carnobacterium alterfunditum TaxID=28230 RepID=A0A1N6HJG7_9LACT|nr:hypothetical protein [Carnobacterium alterfunditum]SIO19876.1 hypothetical protein SAMN05878443_1895 [Carnobacterium alterfunditum]